MARDENYGDSGSPMDGAIQMCKRFISRPPSPQDLEHLLTELESIRDYIKEEDSQESEDDFGKPSEKPKGLAIMIGVGKKKPKISEEK